jgi:hypothetical protein
MLDRMLLLLFVGGKCVCCLAEQSFVDILTGRTKKKKKKKKKKQRKKKKTEEKISVLFST